MMHNLIINSQLTSFEGFLNKLHEAYLDKINDLERANATIEELKSGKYLQNLEKEIKWYRGNLTTITEVEHKTCWKWLDEGKHFDHEYSYVFTPTQLGTVGEVVCRCGESFKFRSL